MILTSPDAASAAEDFTDCELLRRFQSANDEAAFRLLVERYAGLVFGTAQRRLQDFEAARDVSQQVFTVFALKAKSLEAEGGPAGWLHRTAVLLSASAQKREIRRRRTLNLWARESDAVPVQGVVENAETAGRFSPEVLRSLDEALNCLPPADREVILARFYRGLSYREIALSGNASEAALQRRVSRAVQRLGKFLQKRSRAVLSAPAVGAGLKPALSQAAPHGLADLLGPAALSGAKALPWAAALQSRWRVWVPAKGQMILAGGAAAVFAVLAGAGFWLGNRAAREQVATLAWPEKVSAAHRTLSALPPRPAQVRKTVAEIVLEALGHFEAGDPQGSLRGLAALEPLRRHEAREALLLLGDGLYLEAVAQQMIPHLAGMWAETEPREALEWTLSRPEPARGHALQPVMRGWAADDPGAALEWWREIEKERQNGKPLPVSREQWRYLTSPAWTELVRRDAVAVLEQLPQLPPEEEETALMGFNNAGNDPARRGPLLARVAALENVDFKFKVADRMLMGWSHSNPEAAAEWAATLEFSDSLQRLRILGHPVMKWMQHDPAAAGAFMLRQAPAEFRDAIALQLKKQLLRMEGVK